MLDLLGRQPAEREDVEFAVIGLVESGQGSASTGGGVRGIVGLNFPGNQTIHPDPGIRLTESWVEESKPTDGGPATARDHRATEASRRTNAKRRPVEEIDSRGYALATIYWEDVCADRKPYFESGVQPLFPELQRGDENFGCIAAWAWSLSRALDVLEKVPAVDAKRVAVFGFSRLGKAAPLALA